MRVHIQCGIATALAVFIACATAPASAQQTAAPAVAIDNGCRRRSCSRRRCSTGLAVTDNRRKRDPPVAQDPKVIHKTPPGWAAPRSLPSPPPRFPSTSFPPFPRPPLSPTSLTPLLPLKRGRRDFAAGAVGTAPPPLDGRCALRMEKGEGDPGRCEYRVSRWTYGLDDEAWWEKPQRTADPIVEEVAIPARHPNHAPASHRRGWSHACWRRAGSCGVGRHHDFKANITSAPLVRAASG